MESLRVIPVAMFLTGVTLIYAGFKGIKPLDVIRQNLGSLGNGTGGVSPTVPYTPGADYNYVGTVQYRSPGSGNLSYSPSLYS